MTKPSLTPIFSLVFTVKTMRCPPGFDSKYTVPMGGSLYLGIESGNGDYSLKSNPRIASAGISGWSGVPAGRMIYISEFSPEARI